MRRSLAVACLALVLPGWSLVALARQLRTVEWDRTIADLNVTPVEGAVLVHLMILIVSVVLVIVAVPWNSLRFTSLRGMLDHLRVFRRPITWLSAAAAIAPSPPGDTRPPAGSISLPVGAVLSPAMASGVLAHILRRRRDQIDASPAGGFPDRLTDEELRTLASVRRLAIEYDGHTRGMITEPVDVACSPEVESLLAGVERVRTRREQSTGEHPSEWRIVVKVFGYPLVENSHRTVAEFRKRRSLELLTWLVLNRDRPRRSAARTAMWDVDVSDSTFSTVISDMRRALADLDPTREASDWCPPTYSDEIPLSRWVVSDADLLDAALRRFREDPGNVDEVVGYLAWIRDVPFAGTAYSWADLDGTTTRLIILAVDAATTVARWAADNGRRDIVTLAVAAGLRVMPGCEELLSIQEQIVEATARRQLSPRS